MNSFQSASFTASTAHNNEFEQGCAINCYVPMPFRRRARVEILNEAVAAHLQYFYIDYERHQAWPETLGYFHAESGRTNPFSGWAADVSVNSPETNIPNAGKLAWENNYAILDTSGKGLYVGCNLSVAYFGGEWWGEGDDMIWIDGYKWPPDLHGTGSEDYLGQAWGMQDNAFLRNGSSLLEHATGGYQTSYVFHVENPVQFTSSIRVTIEHGHGNDMASVAYWYARTSTPVVAPPVIDRRLPVPRDNWGNWLRDRVSETPGPAFCVTEEMVKIRRGQNGRS